MYRQILKHTQQMHVYASHYYPHTAANTIGYKRNDVIALHNSSSTNNKLRNTHKRQTTTTTFIRPRQSFRLALRAQSNTVYVFYDTLQSVWSQVEDRTPLLEIIYLL